MATTQVLLIKPVENLGGEGEQITVKAGYARNFLFPQKLALPVSRANEKQIQALLKARAVREAKELGDATALKEKLEAINVAIAVKTGEGGKMFGSVTSVQVLEKLAQNGIELPKKSIHMHPVKELGKNIAQIRLHKDVKFDFEFEVVSENPL